MNNSLQTDAFDDVADSTDWLATPLSGLAGVEAALRCQVCKDFYKTPMLTSCNHTFCSLCIRRALSSEGKCPLCRASEQELRLRSNWSMEEAVAAFTKARKDVLDYARKPPEIIEVERVTPKRSLEEAEDEAAAGSQPESKRIRTSARLSKSKGAESMSQMARLEADIPEQRDLYEEAQNYEIDDGLVACPICLARMKPLQVDRHLDTNCPGSPQVNAPPSTSTGPTSRSASIPNTSLQQAISNAPPKPLERLPAINYSSLNDQQLRKKLGALGISVSGHRTMLEKRHREWMTIWNANCDSLHPRRKNELLHDLDIWDRTLGSRAPTMSKSITLGAQIKDKDFDGQAWAAKHESSFKDLIANARKNRKPSQGKAADDDQKPTDNEAPPTLPLAASELPIQPHGLVPVDDQTPSHLAEAPNGTDQAYQMT